MRLENELKDGVKEFVQSATEEENKGRRRSATILYFKAIATVCDYIIYLKFRKIPDNHAERFRILQKHFFPIYKILDKTFPIYQQTYRYNISEEQLNGIKNAFERIRKIRKDIEKSL